MPDTELPVVGECVAQEASVVGWPREGYRLLLNFSIDDGINTVAEAACCRIEVYAAKIIADGVELMITLRERAGRTEVE